MKINYGSKQIKSMGFFEGCIGKAGFPQRDQRKYKMPLNSGSMTGQKASPNIQYLIFSK